MTYEKTGMKVWNVFLETENGSIYNGTYLTKQDAYFAMRELIILKGREKNWSKEVFDNYLSRLDLTYDNSTVVFGAIICWAQKSSIMKVKEA